LALPQGFEFSGDPFLAANPYSSGVGPGRVYASGIALNRLGDQPDAIVVWHSDDGGQSWSTPSIVESSQGTSQLDKPAIGVSWHPNTLGHVHVAYISAGGSGRDLRIAKSTDGGITFNAPVVITSSVVDINGAQVLVNPSWGHVYVLWTDPVAKAIKMSTSLD